MATTVQVWYTCTMIAKSVHFNARLPRDVSERLRRYAQRRRISASAAAVELLDESLRMEGFPGVDFRWTALGRQPFVTGTGLTAWEMRHLWEAHRRSIAALRRNYPHLNAAQIAAGCAYAAAYASEEPAGFWGGKPDFVVEVKV
jgi:uncharacterized protein (DUF433 family)